MVNLGRNEVLISFVLFGLADVSDLCLIDISTQPGGAILGDEDFRTYCIWCWNRKCDLVADSDKLREKARQEKSGSIGEHTGSRFLLPLDANHTLPAHLNGRAEGCKSHAVAGSIGRPCRTAKRRFGPEFNPSDWRFVSCRRRVEMRRDCDPATIRSTPSPERTKSMNADRVSDPCETGLSDGKKIPAGLNNAQVNVNPETDNVIFQPRCAVGS